MYINFLYILPYKKKVIYIVSPYCTIKFMLEKELEKKLVKAIKSLGGICWKLTSPGTVGVPDRICLLNKGKIIFVEVKREGETLRPVQKKRKQELEKLGFKVFVLDSEEKIQEVLNEIQSL